MKKILIISLLFVPILKVQAQQAPQYSQYVFNQFQLNPAVAGTYECLDLRFGFRNQWAGFDDAPKSQFGQVTTRIGKKKRGRPQHGFGLKFELDQAAIFSQSIVQLAYAYHFKMGRDMNGSIGMFAGFNQFKVNLGNVVLVGPTTETDPVLADPQAQNLLVPEVVPGFWMYSETFFFGLSMKHATGNTMIDNGEAKLIQHLNATSGKAFTIGATSKFIPSLRLGYAPGAPLAMDLNALIDFDRKLALGLGYRNGDALIAMMKVNFLSHFTVGYSYDLTLSPIKHAGSNTHEVILAISACPGKSGGSRSPCSAYD